MIAERYVRPLPRFESRCALRGTCRGFCERLEREVRGSCRLISSNTVLWGVTVLSVRHTLVHRVSLRLDGDGIEAGSRLV
jgi:hypothetical protein